MERKVKKLLCEIEMKMKRPENGKKIKWKENKKWKEDDGLRREWNP